VGVQTLLERFRFGVGVAGPDVPPVGESTCGSVAPGEGRQTGKTRVGRGRIEGVQGRDVEPVVGAGGQNRFGRVGEAFLGDTALAQHPRDEFPPLLVCGCREPFGRVRGTGRGCPTLREVHTLDGKYSGLVRVTAGVLLSACTSKKTAPAQRHHPPAAPVDVAPQPARFPPRTPLRRPPPRAPGRVLPPGRGVVRGRTSVGPGPGSRTRCRSLPPPGWSGLPRPRPW